MAREKSLSNSWSFWKTRLHENRQKSVTVITRHKMSERRVSRAAKIPLVSILTMADLAAAVRRDESISDAQKWNELSAIKKACAWVGKKPHMVSISAANVQALIHAVRLNPPP